jgi:hypothetical protein
MFTKVKLKIIYSLVLVATIQLNSAENHQIGGPTNLENPQASRPETQGAPQGPLTPRKPVCSGYTLGGERFTGTVVKGFERQNRNNRGLWDIFEKLEGGLAFNVPEEGIVIFPGWAEVSQSWHTNHDRFQHYLTNESPDEILAMAKTTLRHNGHQRYFDSKVVDLDAKDARLALYAIQIANAKGLGIENFSACVECKTESQDLFNRQTYTITVYHRLNPNLQPVILSATE